ncbi:HK97-gp10 family putative phage morphogenesis protein [Verrucosispora sp. NA02020]|uniref:HK97-gp10 family putative phage morphogenesis protein n=1 Tax=Verrucosispora sp. NA02020 TaxID=2742132 RepID=UPI0015918A32|nr:HK97-gp10 family putative phage morphogenesis protein [Verrucosispora sp. NA02020]QKW15379.1 HK97 gp10 family phage protein [Verrucosispora sp. NA02020]
MVDIRVEGGGELTVIAAQLRTKRASIGREGSQVVRRSALAGEAAAKAFAPVLTGHLKSSIGHEFSGSAATGVMDGEWGAEARYAKWVEGGTSRMAPQPFVGPSLDAVTPGFLQAVEAISDPLGDG